MARALHLRSCGGPAKGRGRVLLAAAALWALCGCLTPPPIEEEPRPGGAPVVDRELVAPSETLVRVDLASDPVLFFSVAGAATDPDGDGLYQYWYLLDEPGQAGRPPETSRTTYVLQPCREDLGIQPTDEFLFLQVDIADRPRLEGLEPPVVGPDAGGPVDAGGEAVDVLRAYPEDAHVVTLEWILYLPAASSCGPET